MNTCNRNSNRYNNNSAPGTSCCERERRFISSPQHIFTDSSVYLAHDDVTTPNRNSTSSSYRNEFPSDDDGHHHHPSSNPVATDSSIRTFPSIDQQQGDSTENYNCHKRYKCNHIKRMKRKNEENSKRCRRRRNHHRSPYHNSSCKSLAHIHHCPLLLPISILLLISLLVHTNNNCHAFTLLSNNNCNHRSISSSSFKFLHVRPQGQVVHHNLSILSSRQLLASTKSSSEETIQAVQPLTTSTAEKRLSVQRAWEEQAQLLEFDENSSSSNRSDDDDDSSMSATPFLDLFSDAGIATVKKVSKSSASSKNVKPRGRPSSVPGAMSRSTLMGINDIQNRGGRATTTTTNNSFYAQNTMKKKIKSAKKRQGRKIVLEREPRNNIIDEHIFREGSFTTAIQSSTDTTANIKSSKGKVKKSSSLSSPITASTASTAVKKTKKGRGRGRPRKDKGNNASIDEITSVAATSTLSITSSESNKQSSSSSKSERRKSNEKGVTKSSAANTNTPTTTRSKRGELKTLRPKSKILKESEKEGETTGMMTMGKTGKGGKDGEPPNLQRYYRTELLTSDEEYMLGMKIQFMMNCELVYDGLCDKLGRNPTIVEWADACGFKEEDENKNDANYLQSDYVNQIRPLKNDGFDPVEDANMFVGNGLVNASGPGRGRGRTKKKPPSELQDYYDDSHIKFEKDFKEKKKLLKPLNRGTPMYFVDLMVRAKEAKQRMVQCNMRLVVSISKRYKHVGVNIADLVQEGSIGLTRAAEKFDPQKGFKFSTYASWWIQQAVFRSIAYHSRTIRLPVHVHNLLNRTRRVRQELQRILGRAPSNDEMAAELNMSVEKYNKMVRLTRKAISLDMAKYQNNPKDIGQESETSLGDTINASDVIRDENSPEQSVDRVLFRDDLKEMLKILGEDERAVIYARYGIEDGMTRTVTTVAAQMGQTKSWVRSQECRALRKLRRPWYEKRLWEHQNSLQG